MWWYQEYARRPGGMMIATWWIEVGNVKNYFLVEEIQEQKIRIFSLWFSSPKPAPDFLLFFTIGVLWYNNNFIMFQRVIFINKIKGSCFNNHSLFNYYLVLLLYFGFTLLFCFFTHLHLDNHLLQLLLSSFKSMSILCKLICHFPIMCKYSMNYKKLDLSH